MTGTVPNVFATQFGSIPLQQLDANFAYMLPRIRSVIDYGAIGDGVADDTAAIQAAITASVGAKDRRLFFPTGTYKVTSTIVVSGPVMLLGNGKWQTIISRTGDYGDTFQWGGGLSSVIDIQMFDMWLFFDMGMTRNGLGQTTAIARKPTTGAHVRMLGGINCRITRCRLDNMVDNLVIDGGAYNTFHECEFTNLFDQLNAGMQSGISNVTLLASNAGVLGHPVVSEFSMCSFYGYYSPPRNVTFNATVVSLSENIGPLYMMRVLNAEVLYVHGGYMGGANSYSLAIDTSIATVSHVTAQGVHFDGDRLSNIYIGNGAGSGTAYNTIINGCTFVGGNGLNCILTPDNGGVGAQPYMGLDISCNEMFQVVSTPISLSDGTGARIVGNNIRSYNLYNAFATQALASGIAVMGHATKAMVGLNALGGGLNYEAPGANNHCLFGVYVQTLTANGNVVLPGVVSGVNNSIDRAATFSPSLTVRGDNEAENLRFGGEVSVAGAVSQTAQNQAGGALIPVEYRASAYHYIQGFLANYYNSFTDLGNFEAMRATWNGSNVFELMMRAAGTGVARDIKIGSAVNGSTLLFRMNDVDRWAISSGGTLFPVTDNATPIGSVTNRAQRVYTMDLQNRSGAADPTTSDIPAGGFMVWKNTTLPEIRLWFNDAGTMKKSVALT